MKLHNSGSNARAPRCARGQEVGACAIALGVCVEECLSLTETAMPAGMRLMSEDVSHPELAVVDCSCAAAWYA